MVGPMSETYTERGISRQAELAIREFQQAKAKFVQELHQLLLPQRTNTPVPFESLLNSDVISLLTCPLINDPVSGIQSLSTQCLAALTRGTEGSGLALCKNGSVSTVLAALDHPNKNVQCDANILLQAIAKESAACVHELVKLGVLEGLRPQLESLDRDVQRCAAETLEVLAESDADVAEEMLPRVFGLLTVDADPGLRTAAVRVLSSASSHQGDIGRRLADDVLVSGAVKSLWTVAKDAMQLKLRELMAEVFTCLANIARHSEELAAACVPDASCIQLIRVALTDEDKHVRTSSTALVYQLSRHGQLAEFMVQAGICPPLVTSMFTLRQSPAVEYAVLAVGHLAAWDSSYARALINSNLAQELERVLDHWGNWTNPNMNKRPASRISTMSVHSLGGRSQAARHLQTGPRPGQGGAGLPQSASVAHREAQAESGGVDVMVEKQQEIVTSIFWAIEQLASKGSDIAVPLAKQGIVDGLIKILKREEPEQTALFRQSKLCLKILLKEVDEQELLEPLVHINTPYSVLKIVLWETLKGLKIRPQLRKSFVTSGSLQRLQSLLTVTDVPLEIIELLKEINAQFPQDVVTYYQKVLALERTATQDEVKKAYFKMALKLHPDKNPGDEEAKERFQQLQKVYSVLGDPERRKMYDETGATEDEALQTANCEDMYEYFRSMYKKVTVEDILNVEAEYRGSEEERNDVLRYYEEGEGDMQHVYAYVMCSEPELDDHRFCDMIEKAIDDGVVGKFSKFSKWAKKIRSRKEHPNPLAARSREGLGAGVGPGSGGPVMDLAAAIQANQISRGENFLNALEAKYSKKKGSGGSKKTGGKRKAGEGDENDQTEALGEPSEEEFAAARRRLEEKGARFKAAVGAVGAEAEAEKKGKKGGSRKL